MSFFKKDATLYIIEEGVECEDCKVWFHTPCVGLSEDDFQNIVKQLVSWSCYACKMKSETGSKEVLNVIMQKLFQLEFKIGAIAELRKELEQVKQDQKAVLDEVQKLKNEVNKLQQSLQIAMSSINSKTTW